MSVRVVARIRPLLEKELDKDIIVRPDSVEPGKPHTIIKIPSPKNGAEEFSFAFNAVYDQSTSQETLFTSEGTVHRVSPQRGARAVPHHDNASLDAWLDAQTFLFPKSAMAKTLCVSLVCVQCNRILNHCSKGTMSPSSRTA